MRWIAAATLVLCLGAGVGAALWLGRGPDFRVDFYQVVDLKAPAEKVERSIRELRNWPSWHRHLKDAYAIDASARRYPDRDQRLMQGSLIRLAIEPASGQRFEMTAQADVYQPGRRLAVRVVDDSAGRPDRVLGDLRWEINLQQPGRVAGSAYAWTKSWKGRLFARLGWGGLMEQALYPDLEKLASMEKPVGTESAPPAGR